MKLAAIYNVWDGIELLYGSMLSLKGYVEKYIVVYQTISNYGERYNPLTHKDFELIDNEFNVEYVLYQPQITKDKFAAKNETAKRNMGIDVARKQGYSHFIMMDCDEYYEDFGKLVDLYLAAGQPGSVCPMYTYFKRPTWRFQNMDNYFVPTIHKMEPDTKTGFFPYPYYVDPTRRINCKEVSLLTEPMHHFSWVRLDMPRKIRNSTARNNIMVSSLYEDWEKAEPFMRVVHFQNQTLIPVPDLFNLDSKFYE